jgi:hypothetical protein
MPNLTKFHAPIWCLFFAAPLAAAEINIQELLHKMQQADERNAATEKNYIFEQRKETRTIESDGKVKSREVETYDTIITGGRPYRRLIARDDKPLSPDEEKKERAKQEKEALARSHETPKQQREKAAAGDARRRKNRELTQQAFKAFDFRVVEEDASQWVLALTPKHEYKASSADTEILRHLKGKLWISKKDLVWTRFDAEVIDSISFGLVLARLEQGSHIAAERKKINDEVWMAGDVSGGGAAKIAMVKKVRVEFDVSSKNFRRFSSDSRLVADPPAK